MVGPRLRHAKLTTEDTESTEKEAIVKTRMS